VITADLVLSRRLPDRRGAQRKLLDLVQQLNAEFHHELAAPFMITLGDEIQGLVRYAPAFPPVVSRIHAVLRPDTVTIGIGIGDVSTEVSSRVTEMDGPAFVNARTAVESAKGKKQEVVVLSGDERVDTILNTLYSFIGGVQSRWTRKQWERVSLYKQHKVLERVAEEAGVTKQAISADLRHTLWDRVLAAEARLPGMLTFLLDASPQGAGS
jgi:hypothetical protein